MPARLRISIEHRERNYEGIQAPPSVGLQTLGSIMRACSTGKLDMQAQDRRGHHARSISISNRLETCMWAPGQKRTAEGAPEVLLIKNPLSRLNEIKKFG